MSWSLSIYGHGATAAKAKEGARAAWDALKEAGAQGGSLSGSENGEAFSITFPEAESAETAETSEEGGS